MTFVYNAYNALVSDVAIVRWGDQCCKGQLSDEIDRKATVKLYVCDVACYMKYKRIT